MAKRKKSSYRDPGYDDYRAILSFIEDGGKTLYYIGTLRERFTDKQIKNFLSFNWDIEYDKRRWLTSAPSHTQEENIDWIWKNVNNLLNFRGITYYIYRNR